MYSFITGLLIGIVVGTFFVKQKMILALEELVQILISDKEALKEELKIVKEALKKYTRKY